MRTTRRRQHNDSHFFALRATLRSSGHRHFSMDRAAEAAQGDNIENARTKRGTAYLFCVASCRRCMDQP